MSPAEIRARCGERFRLLRSAGPVRVSRHATLVALVDWSFNLLSEPEQRLLIELGVFVGGFDLAAAHAVRSGGGDELETLDMLDVLVEQSLVQVGDGGGRTRYSLLETIRQYALGRWSGDDDRRLRRRHAEYFVGFAEWADRRDDPWRGTGAVAESC